MQTGTPYKFLCNRWLDVGEDDGAVCRNIDLTDDDDFNDFDYLFQKVLYQNMYDGHIWLSLVTRPLQSSFTTVQRLCACFTLLLTSMLANAMFYKTG